MANLFCHSVMMFLHSLTVSDICAIVALYITIKSSAQK